MHTTNDAHGIVFHNKHGTSISPPDSELPWVSVSNHEFNGRVRKYTVSRTVPKIPYEVHVTLVAAHVHCDSPDEKNIIDLGGSPTIEICGERTLNSTRCGQNFEYDSSAKTCRCGLKDSTNTDCEEISLFNDTKLSLTSSLYTAFRVYSMYLLRTTTTTTTSTRKPYRAKLVPVPDLDMIGPGCPYDGAVACETAGVADSML